MKINRYFDNAIVAEDFKHGPGLSMGYYCVIHEDVIVGRDVKIRSFVELRPGTVIGNGCYIDSDVRSSGLNKIGNNVTLRYGAIIARGCEIGDGCYVCPQVMTNNLNHKGESVGGAKVGENCFIGTNATLGAGITIAPNTVIGAKALVLDNIETPGTVWVGIPARQVKPRCIYLLPGGGCGTRIGNPPTRCPCVEFETDE